MSSLVTTGLTVLIAVSSITSMLIALAVLYLFIQGVLEGETTIAAEGD